MRQYNNIDILVNFVKQRAGLDFSNYGDVSAFRKEQREITNDRKDFFELLQLATQRIDNLNEEIGNILRSSSDRLTMKEDGTLQYVTGQYFPTEYRPAASRVLRQIIWNSYMNEKKEDGTAVYETGDAIRKAIRRNVSRRVAKNYFN